MISRCKENAYNSPLFYLIFLFTHLLQPDPFCTWQLDLHVFILFTMNTVASKTAPLTFITLLMLLHGLSSLL